MTRQADPETTSTLLAVWMAPFAVCFTRPTWANLLVLVAGAILSPGRRTIAAALSSMGLRGAATFTNYHRVLNRSRWSGQAAARCLLGLLVAAFVPSGPVVVGIDETIERRWGARIKARGIYRDPVRSSHGHFVQSVGLALGQPDAARTRAVRRSHRAHGAMGHCRSSRRWRRPSATPANRDAGTSC